MTRAYDEVKHELGRPTEVKVKVEQKKKLSRIG